MPSIKLVLRNSLASTLHPESLRVRQEFIDNIDRPVHKKGALALHRLAIKNPRIVSSLIQLDYPRIKEEYRPSDLQVVGSGMDSTVFRLNTNEVLKVNWRSILLSPPERQTYLEKRAAEHKTLVQGLGGFVLGHETFIAPPPFFPERQAVQIRQAYRDVTDPQLFPARCPNALASKIDGLQSEQPDIAAQLGEFLTRSRRLYDKSQLLPDTEGTSNLLLEPAGNLRLVDAQPIGSDNRRVQSAILGHLDILSSALALAA